MMALGAKPSAASRSARTGWRAFMHRRCTRPSVSSPLSVVRSMQVMAFSSQAACASFLTARRVPSVAVRRSTADWLTRSASSQAASNATPALRAVCAAGPPRNTTSEFVEASDIGWEANLCNAHQTVMVYSHPSYTCEMIVTILVTILSTGVSG
ncbi:hypothetical protein PUN4_280070 [Paraburkholderia unamae]|nr:hypothetical protein PUN4_280070 [Paraburkholderia unamae]